MKNVPSRNLKGTKYSYDRRKVIRLGKAFNCNQMLGYVEWICDKGSQISIYIWSAYCQKIIRLQ